MRALYTSILVALLALPGCRNRSEKQPPTTYGNKAAPTAAPAPTDKIPSFDLWYRIQADGQPIGYRHVSLVALRSKQGPQLGLESDQHTRLTAGAGAAAQRLRMQERCAPDGTLMTLAIERKTAHKIFRRKYVIDGNVLVTIDPDSGRRTRATLPKGPRVAGLCALYLALLDGVDSRTLRTLDPATGKLVTGFVLRTPGTTDQYRYSESSQPQVKTELFVGPSRLPVKLTVTGLGPTLRLSLSTRAEANKTLAKATREPAQGQVVDLHARLPDPLDARRIRYALTPTKPLPQAALAELNRGDQRRLPGKDATRVVVEVTRKVPGLTAAAMPYPLTKAAIRPVRAWLVHPTPALDRRDIRLVQLGVLTRGESSALRVALRLGSWATIAPTRGFKDRAGLLVAALRAAGIPARLVYGFLYVGSVMTEHTWVEAWIGSWISLDPEIGRAAGPAHLRLATSPAAPNSHPATTWRHLEPKLVGLRARLVEATLASGFRFVPGAKNNANQVANVLYHRVWNLVVRRPLTARFVMPGKSDPYDLAVISTDGKLQLRLVLYAASAAGLDPAAFRAQGYQPRRIGLRNYLVRDLGAKPGTPAAMQPAMRPTTPAMAAMAPAMAMSPARLGMPAAPSAKAMSPARLGMPAAPSAMAMSPARLGMPAAPSAMANMKPPRPIVPSAKPAGKITVRRRYVQIACSTKPWGARLVRWTLTAKDAAPRSLTDLEAKVLGTFQMTGHPAGTTGCTKPRVRKPTP